MFLTSHSPSSFRPGFAVALLVLFVAPAESISALDQVKTPITVSVSPEVLTAGVRVQIDGTSIPLGVHKTIEVRIRPPQGAVESYQLVLDNQSFSMEYPQTAAEGRYTVVAISADGKNNARTFFEVVKPSVLRQQSFAQMGSDFERLGSASENFQKTLANAPASVARDELVTRITATTEQLAGLEGALDDLDRALELLEQSAERVALCRVTPPLPTRPETTLCWRPRQRESNPQA